MHQWNWDGKRQMNTKEKLILEAFAHNHIDIIFDYAWLESFLSKILSVMVSAFFAHCTKSLWNVFMYIKLGSDSDLRATEISVQSIIVTEDVICFRWIIEKWFSFEAKKKKEKKRYFPSLC